MNKFYLILLMFLFLTSCSQTNSTSQAQLEEIGPAEPADAHEEEMITVEPSIGFYSNTNQQFNGYPCTQDCSGHEAGYQWAAENSISDESDCYGNSQSFIEGCQSYVEENEGQSEE